ncbi:TPA: 30S ribosomal protein S3 [Candidatus Berkelbacteria bacterium]|uniref:Small ribosomal subunit protein uS3 n=1 Tax=Berkelbacteria bacterium GW2011_GWE1_39_12 TaxID=1618337 RepID=A0A0G4B3Z7_9BACT|nr:MAG: 30S ribosomal protein S3, small subunit ribosomal protein S3 [Berkelbacteria bacterium GW2011_GWE1_39_12]HBO60222.1 30S ribosomal protein S3 [Candidatus Berkelbacteria bacterium]
MGQKVNPISFRLPLNKDWQSKWFSKGNFAKNLAEDLAIRQAIEKKYGKTAGIGRVEVLRDNDSITVNLHSSKPGILIGRSGQGVIELKAYLLKNVAIYKTMDSNKQPKIKVDVIEIKAPELNAQLVAENIAIQIEKRIPFKRATKQAIQKTMEMRAKGIKIQVSGRLGGAEIARSEKYGEGSVPLGRLKANVDYGYAIAMTTYGTIGVKTWIYKGDILKEEKEKN